MHSICTHIRCNATAADVMRPAHHSNEDRVQKWGTWSAAAVTDMRRRAHHSSCRNETRGAPQQP